MSAALRKLAEEVRHLTAQIPRQSALTRRKVPPIRPHSLTQRGVEFERVRYAHRCKVPLARTGYWRNRLARQAQQRGSAQ